MAAAALELVMKLKDEASADLDKVEGKLGGVNKAALAIGTAGVVAIGAFAAGLASCVEAAKNEEIGIANLKAAVDATGTSYDTVSDSIETYIAAATRKTAYDDGDQREAISRLTQTTGDYKTALDLMPLAMDLARAKGIELGAAAEIVGKVHEGNTGILSRYGIVLGEGATAQEALAQMQGMFAGQAEAYGGTFAAAQDKMGIALGNLKETIGAAVLPILTTFITKLADMATDLIPKVESAMNALWPVIQTAWETIQTVINTAWGVIKPIFDALVAWFSGPGTTETSEWSEELTGIWQALQTLIETVAGLIKLAVETAFGAIAGFLQAHGDTIKGIIDLAWGGIKNAIDTILGIIKGVIDAWTAALNGDWQGVWDAIKGIVSTAWDGIKSYIETMLGIIQGIIGLGWGVVKGAAEAAWDAIKGVISTVWDGIVSAVTGKVDDVRLAMGNGWNTIHGAAVRSFNSIKEAILSPLNEAKRLIDGIISGIITAWQRLGSFHIPLPHFRAGTRDVSVAGISFPIPDIGIDWYGKGLPSTVFDKPTLIGVGERGPERVTVTPLGKEGGAAAGGGVTITGNTFNVRSDQDIERVAREIVRQMMQAQGQRVALGSGVYVP